MSSLPAELLKETTYIIQKAKEWYATDRHLFQYRGGRFVHNVFAGSWPALESALRDAITSDEDISFAVQVLRTFEGDAFLHPFVQELVERVSPGSAVLDELAYVLDESGVVSGEFGFVELYQSRKAQIATWLDHSSARVREFAERYILSLERRIAAEQRRAEEDYELRKRNWGPDGPGEE